VPDLTAVNWRATPRSSEERELIALIRNQPDNLQHRLIYAYFLHEQGTTADDAKAALIRYMCGDEPYREVFSPRSFTGVNDGVNIYRRVIGGEGDGSLLPSGRLMLHGGLVSEAHISSPRTSDEEGARAVARALSAHPVSRLVLDQTSAEVANILEYGSVMDGVRSLVLIDVVGGGRLGAVASRLEEVTCTLSEAAGVCKDPISAVELPSDRVRVLSAVNILERENVLPPPGPWRLLGRHVSFRVQTGEASVMGLERFVAPEVTRSLQVEGILSLDAILEAVKLAPTLERLSFVGCSISDESWRTLLSYDFPKLRELQIQATDAPPDTLRLLSQNLAARSLSWIRLAETPQRLDGGLELLADRELFPSLKAAEVGAEKRSALLLAGVVVHPPTFFGWRS
jgi:uncharacterized protein (TIGR02996 family)